jgi:uncharacterized protein (DUF1330 family)
MSAYVISEVEVLDEDLANEYRALAAASIEQFGGRYIVRGAEPNVAEGTQTTRRIVIVEFPTMERLHEWYASAEYAKALTIRARALDRRLMFVEGVGEA